MLSFSAWHETDSIKYLFTILTLLSLESIYLSAQKWHTEGTVVEKESKERIPFASIAIIDATESSAIIGTVSGNTGKLCTFDPRFVLPI